MVVYGSGPAYAAQCPAPVIPAGYRYWNPDIDGPVPAPLAARAQAVASDQTVPLGATESFPLPGVTVLIVCEPHAWSTDAAGNAVEGCFHGATVFLPTGAAPPAAPTAPSSLSTAVGVLTLVSLVAGLWLTVPELVRS